MGKQSACGGSEDHRLRNYLSFVLVITAAVLKNVIAAADCLPIFSSVVDDTTQSLAALDVGERAAMASSRDKPDAGEGMFW